MGVASSHNCQPQSTVPKGKIRICVVGFWYSPFTGRAHKLADYLAATYPDQFESWYWFHWENKGQFFRYTIDTFEKVPFPQEIKGHSTGPMVWLEVCREDATGAAAEACNAIDGGNVVLEAIGGNYEFQRWVRQHTQKADGTPVEAPAAPQSDEEIAAKVSQAPKALYFKDSEELKALYNSWAFADMKHVTQYGSQTAAAAASSTAPNADDSSKGTAPDVEGSS